jgi:hypothetical protein
MEMQIARGLAAFVSAMALSWSSFAATVTPEQGIVLVNRGNGYQNVTEPSYVRPGDIVVVNPGGSAQLAYNDGCFVPVAVGLIVTVEAESPCATQGSMTPTQASGPPPPGPGPYPEGSSPPQGGGLIGLPDATMVVPGLVLGAVVLGVAFAKDKPASP